MDGRSEIVDGDDGVGVGRGRRRRPGGSLQPDGVGLGPDGVDVVVIQSDVQGQAHVLDDGRVRPDRGQTQQ